MPGHQRWCQTPSLHQLCLSFTLCSAPAMEDMDCWPQPGFWSPPSYSWAWSQWMRQQGMLWDQLMLALCEALKSRGQPDILVLHLGEIDLVACSMLQLLDNLRQDIAKIQCLMPGARLVWAAMLPRHIRCGASSNKVINLARRKANKQVSKIIGWNHGTVYHLARHSLWSPSHLLGHIGLICPPRAVTSTWPTWQGALRQQLGGGVGNESAKAG